MEGLLEGFENEGYAVAAFVTGAVVSYALLWNVGFLGLGGDLCIILATVIGAASAAGLYLLLTTGHGQLLLACPKCGSLDIDNEKCASCGYAGAPVELSGLQEYLSWKGKLE